MSGPGGEWVAVEVIPNAIEVEVRKAVLEGYGIPVHLRSQSIINPALRGVHAGPLGEVSILVPADRAEDARSILNDNSSDADEPLNVPE